MSYGTFESSNHNFQSDGINMDSKSVTLEIPGQITSVQGEENNNPSSSGNTNNNGGELPTNIPPVATEIEPIRKIVLQIFPSIILSGIGMVGAGLELDKVQLWNNFLYIHILFRLVIPLLGMKITYQAAKY